MSKIDYKAAMQELRMQRYKDIADYSKVVELGVETMWQQLCDQVDSPDLDPVDLFADELEKLRDMEYSMKLMNICCLSETWEQDLFNFIKEKGLTDSNSNDFFATRDTFEREYRGCRISSFPLIIEMRALVNAIKHGEGGSFANVRRLTRDSILADSNWGEMDENGNITRKKQIEFDGNTLTSRTLNVDGKIEKYSNEIINFWKKVFEADKAKDAARTLE